MRAIAILFVICAVSTGLTHSEIDVTGNLFGLVGGVSNVVPSATGIKLPNISTEIFFGVLYIIAKLLTSSSDETGKLANGINPERMST